MSSPLRRPFLPLPCASRAWVRSFFLSSSLSFSLPPHCPFLISHIAFYATRSSEELLVGRSRSLPSFFFILPDDATPPPLPLSSARGKRLFSYSSVFFSRFIRVVFSAIQISVKILAPLGSVHSISFSRVFCLYFWNRTFSVLTRIKVCLGQRRNPDDFLLTKNPFAGSMCTGERD